MQAIVQTKPHAQRASSSARQKNQDQSEKDSWISPGSVIEP
jgi:hypothetical protein